MSLRNINSPGVEITELDLSQYAPAMVGTSFLVMGFSDKGEEFNPLEITSMDDFETNFGRPNNEAERYFYYTAKDVVRNNANLIATKLPYNNVISKNYKWIGISVDNESSITTSDPVDLQEISGYFSQKAMVTTSTTMNIATSAYDAIAAGADFTGAQAAYDFIIVNENKARINGAEGNQGIFTVIVDMIDALNVQRMFPNPSDDDQLSLITGIDYPSGIVASDFAQPLTGTYVGSSVSEDLMRQFPTIEFISGGTLVDPYYAQQLGVIVCNTVADPNNEGKLNVGILEAFVGSINPNKKDPATGLSIYLGDLINNQSKYIKWYANLDNASLLPDPNDTSIVLYKADDEYPLIGFTDAECEKRIVGQTIVQNMKNVFEKLSNIDGVQIDVVADAGLSTIAEFTNDSGAAGSIFDPVNDPDDGYIDSTNKVEYWRSVASEFIGFCQDIRKDCMTVLDAPRNLVLEGNQKYIRKTAPENTFSNTIGKALRYITGLNSSYAALYSNWTKAIDDFTGVAFWLPPTTKVVGIYANNDFTANIWDAPAGLNRGIIDGIVDLSFNPNRKAADQIYMKSINYAKKYPLDGFILEGQKTTQVKPSAFDRVNVRRLFLRLERLTYQVARYFVYEPNSEFTRRRLVDVLTPIFQATKAAGGLYDYMIVCDESNNPPEVIDRNELHVAILLKPVRSIEFLLVKFIATRTDANFEEILNVI